MNKEIKPSLFLEPVQAGFASPIHGYAERALDLNELMVKHPAATFFVKAEGESMKGAGIMPGDILVVDRSLEADSNKIVIAVVDGEFTVKRFIKGPHSITLKPENEKFQPIVITEPSRLQIWGVVTYVIHKLS